MILQNDFDENLKKLVYEDDFIENNNHSQKKKYNEDVKNKKQDKKIKSLLIAMSSGIDSSVLTNLLLNCSLNIKIGIFHLNHKFREDSYLDFEIAQKIALENNLEFFGYEFDVEKEAKENKKSFENYARELRYKLIYCIMNKNNYDYVLTGHHKDDNAESVLMNIFRGSSLSGLLGIKEKTYKIIRPLLNYTKSEIINYAKENHIIYRYDYTNFENNYYRNKIRNQIIPEINDIVNIDLSNKINILSENIKNDYDFIENCVVNEINKVLKIEKIFGKIQEPFNYLNALHNKNYEKEYSESAYYKILELDIKKVNLILLNRIVIHIIYIINGNNKDILKKNIDNCVNFILNANNGDFFELKNIRFEKRKMSIKIFSLEYLKKISSDYIYQLKIGENKIKFTNYNLKAKLIFLEKSFNKEKLIRFIKNKYENIDEDFIEFQELNDLNQSLENTRLNNKILYIPLDNLDDIKKIIIRNKRDGDVIKTNNTKKVKKIFNELNLSSIERQVLPIVEYDKKIISIFKIKKVDLFKNIKNKEYVKFIKIYL